MQTPIDKVLFPHSPTIQLKLHYGPNNKIRATQTNKELMKKDDQQGVRNPISNQYDTMIIKKKGTGSLLSFHSMRMEPVILNNALEIRPQQLC